MVEISLSYILVWEIKRIERHTAVNFVYRHQYYIHLENSNSNSRCFQPSPQVRREKRYELLHIKALVTWDWTRALVAWSCWLIFYDVVGWSFMIFWPIFHNLVGLSHGLTLHFKILHSFDLRHDFRKEILKWWNYSHFSDLKSVCKQTSSEHC